MNNETYNIIPRHAIARAPSADTYVYKFTTCTMLSLAINDKLISSNEISQLFCRRFGTCAAQLMLVTLMEARPVYQQFMLRALLMFVFDTTRIHISWDKDYNFEPDNDFVVWFSVACRSAFGRAAKTHIMDDLGVEWPLSLANPFVYVVTPSGPAVVALAHYFDGCQGPFSTALCLTAGQRKLVQRHNALFHRAVAAGEATPSDHVAFSDRLYDEYIGDLAPELSEPVTPQGIEEQAAGDFLRAFFTGNLERDAEAGDAAGNYIDQFRFFIERVMPRIHHVHKHSLDLGDGPGKIYDYIVSIFRDPNYTDIQLILNIVGLVASVSGYRKTAGTVFAILGGIRAGTGNPLGAVIAILIGAVNFADGINQDKAARVETHGLETLVTGAITAKFFHSIFPGASELSVKTITDEFEKRIGRYKRDLEGAQELLQNVTSLTVQFFGYLASKTGLDWLRLETNDPYWDVTSYLDRVDEVRSEYDKKQNGPQMDARLSALQTEGKALRVSLSRGGGNNAAQANRIHQALASLFDMRLKLSRSLNANSAMKPVPIAVTLTGPPGIGKTVFTHLLWPRLLPSILTREQLKLALTSRNVASYVYPLNPSDQYMSGYDGQPICLIDELGAATENATNANIWLEMIRLINTAPTQLNMADLDNKGRQWFTSRFVVCTSNLKHFGKSVLQGSVREVAAVHRRMGHSYVVGLKPEYCTPETAGEQCPFKRLPDKAKMKALSSGTKTIGWDHIEMFEYTDLEGGVFDPNPISPDRVVEILKEAAREAERERDRLVEAQRVALMEEAAIVGDPDGIADKIDDDIVAEILKQEDIELDAEESPGTFPTEGANDKGEAAEHPDDATVRAGDRATPADDSAWWRSPAKAFAVASLAVPLVGLGARLLIGYLKEKPDEQAYGPRNKANKLNFSAKRTTTAVQAGSVAQVQTSEALASHNFYEVSVRCTDGRGEKIELRQGQTLLAKNGIAIVPDHFLAQWRNITTNDSNGACDPNATVVFKSKLRQNGSTGDFAPVVVEVPAVTLTLPKRAFEISTGDGADLVAIYVRGLSGRDIMGHFRDASAINAGLGIKSYRLSMRSSTLVMDNFVFTRRDGGAYTDTTKDLIANSFLYYHANCAKGDCGAPIISERDNKVCGIHVAGSDTTGYAPVIEVDKLKRAAECLYEIWGVKRDLGSKALPECHSNLFADAEPVTRQGGLGIGRVKPMAMASKTKISPSPIQGLAPWAPKTAPAMLRPQGSVDPMDNAMWGYGLGGSCIPQSVYLAARDSYLEILAKCPGPLQGRNKTLTFEEAVQGVEDDQYAGSIDRSKSPGWPWAYTQGFKRKAFGEDAWTYHTPEAKLVREVVDHDMGLLRQGQRPFWLHQHFLKDERRSLAKVSAGQTRLISSSPLHAVICTRMLCLSFSSWMMHNRVVNGFGVGVNPHSDDWSLMARFLGANNNTHRVMCGDFKAWDKRLGQQSMEALGDAMDLFYADAGSSDSVARWTIIADLQNSRHIDGSVVYEWTGSNPSGNALTTVLNSVCNQVATRSAFILALVKKGFDLTLAKAAVSSDHFYAVVYGDDVGISVRKGTIFDCLTGEDIEAAFKDMGLTYTDANKGGVAQFETIDEASFLKRTFRQNHYSSSRWMAPLAWETITESIQWWRDGETRHEDWKRNVRSMALEASAHGREAYTAYVQGVQGALKQLPQCPVISFPNWEAAQDELLKTEFLF